MKIKNKVRRVVNLDKTQFDTIKKYCEINTLNMPKWLGKLAVTEINKVAFRDTIKSKIQELIGEATVCWSTLPHGVFNSTRASEISDEIFNMVFSSEFNMDNSKLDIKTKVERNNNVCHTK